MVEGFGGNRMETKGWGWIWLGGGQRGNEDGGNRLGTEHTAGAQ